MAGIALSSAIGQQRKVYNPAEGIPEMITHMSDSINKANSQLGASLAQDARERKAKEVKKKDDWQKTYDRYNKEINVKVDAADPYAKEYHETAAKMLTDAEQMHKEGKTQSQIESAMLPRFQELQRQKYFIETETQKLNEYGKAIKEFTPDGLDAKDYEAELIGGQPVRKFDPDSQEEVVVDKTKPYLERGWKENMEKGGIDKLYNDKVSLVSGDIGKTIKSVNSTFDTKKYFTELDSLNNDGTISNKYTYDFDGLTKEAEETAALINAGFTKDARAYKNKLTKDLTQQIVEQQNVPIEQAYAMAQKQVPNLIKEQIYNEWSSQMDAATNKSHIREKSKGININFNSADGKMETQGGVTKVRVDNPPPSQVLKREKEIAALEASKNNALPFEDKAAKAAEVDKKIAAKKNEYIPSFYIALSTKDKTEDSKLEFTNDKNEPIDLKDGQVFQDEKGKWRLSGEATILEEQSDGKVKKVIEKNYQVPLNTDNLAVFQKNYPKAYEAFSEFDKKGESKSKPTGSSKSKEKLYIINGVAYPKSKAEKAGYDITTLEEAE